MGEVTRRAWPRRVAYGLMIVGTPLLLLALLALVSVSPVPMRGAKMFGGIANAIKGNPGATAGWAVGGGVALWVVIGGMVAVQEWRGRERGAV